MSGELEKVEGGGNGSEPQRLGKRGKVIVGMIVVLNIIAICVGFALVSRSFDMTISATTTTTTSTTTASTLAPPARCWGSEKHFHMDAKTTDFHGEEGDYYEGDMIIQRRKVTAPDHYRWPNGSVPYEVEGSFTSSELEVIHEAASYFNNRTTGCVKWVERTNETDYVAIKSDNSGCWSYVGRISGRQYLNLQTPGCVYNGIVQHEMLHALGTWHEHSRPDRINWENIVSGEGHNFERKNPSYVLLHGSYDYGSVMHYSSCGFSSNGWETITTIDPSANIGQRNGMSQIDVDKLMNYYECD